MPFTGSHPAAVLPLLRTGLVPSALVIGSMVPDLPYYLPLSGPADATISHQTHTTGGVFGLDLALGLVVFLIWHLLITPLAVAVAPAGLRSRLAPGLPVPWRRHLNGPRAVLLVVLSLWIGAATHVLWDEFTHAGRWGPRHLAWLATRHGPLVGYKWGQYGSGVVGAALIAHALWRWWRATESVDQGLPPQRVPVLARPAMIVVLTTIGVATLAGMALGGLHGLVAEHSLHQALFRIATWGGGAALFAVLGCALVCAVFLRTPDPL